MGMSLWRMYSAKEQDQPPSVLLVGTFCKNQQGTGPGVGDLMPQVDQATSVPRKAEPSHIHQSFPWRMFIFPPATTQFPKFHFTRRTAPLSYTVSLEPASCNERLHSFLPMYFASAFPKEKGTIEMPLLRCFIRIMKGTTPKPSRSFQAETSVLL